MLLYYNIILNKGRTSFLYPSVCNVAIVETLRGTLCICNIVIQTFDSTAKRVAAYMPLQHMLTTSVVFGK